MKKLWCFITGASSNRWVELISLFSLLTLSLIFILYSFVLFLSPCLFYYFSHPVFFFFQPHALVTHCFCHFIAFSELALGMLCWFKPNVPLVLRCVNLLHTRQSLNICNIKYHAVSHMVSNSGIIITIAVVLAGQFVVTGVLLIVLFFFFSLSLLSLSLSLSLLLSVWFHGCFATAPMLQSDSHPWEFSGRVEKYLDC